MYTLTPPATAVSALAAAVQPVNAESSKAGVKYFDFEKQQLTDSALADLTTILLSTNASHVNLFAFANFSDDSLGKRANSCKALPGDDAWPSTSVWWLFDVVLGNSLIEGVPAAAACYEDWPQYDEVRCSEIQDSWTDPSWQ